MLMYAQRPDVGVVSANIWNNKDQSYFAGGVLDQDSLTGIHVINKEMDKADQGYEANMRHVRNTTTASGICMMVPERTFEKIGDFSAEMQDCADIDLCLRSREKGLWNVWTCFAEFSYSKALTIEVDDTEIQKFISKWESRISKKDNFYNQNLAELGIL